MKVIFYIFILVVFVVSGSPLYGQEFRASDDKLYLSLIEDVHILTLFVDTEDDYWEDDEMEYYANELSECQEWLTDEAAAYNQSLSFQNEKFRENNELIYIRQVRRGYPSRLIQQVMDELSYEDIETFFEENRFDFSKERFKILLMVKNNSRSHAYNLWSKNDVDIAIVYCRSTYGMRTDRYVMAHEILHQFGAWDLYEGEVQTPEKAAIALEKYPNSVMINTHTNQENLMVDELTAYLIGWHNNFDESFNVLKPKRE